MTTDTAHAPVSPGMALSRASVVAPVSVPRIELDPLKGPLAALDSAWNSARLNVPNFGQCSPRCEHTACPATAEEGWTNHVHDLCDTAIRDVAALVDRGRYETALRVIAGFENDAYEFVHPDSLRGVVRAIEDVREAVGYQFLGALQAAESRGW